VPFTFSHPAIILPLKKLSPGAFSLTGLIIGSITPDFEYFIRMKVKSIYSHSLVGVFWFDIPLAILLTFVYHNNVRNKLTANLPAFLNNRLNGFATFDWNDFFKKNWLVVVLSIVIGAASHLLWDSFTHPAGFFVQRLGVLQKGINIFQKHVPLYSILQQLSTLIGGAIVIWAILRLKSKKSIQSPYKVFYWLIVGGITAITLGCRFCGGLNFHMYGDIIMTTIAGFIFAIIIAPAIFRLSSGKTTSRQQF